MTINFDIKKEMINKVLFILGLIFHQSVYSQVTPWMTSAMINSCQGGCVEGQNEILFLNTGGYSINVPTAGTNVQVTYTSTGITYGDSWVNMTATTTAINTAAGCPGLFVNAYNTTIPPNSSVIIANDQLCANALVWSSLCGTGPIYIMYSGDASWGTGGVFGNTAGLKGITLGITTTSGSVFTANYQYNFPSASNDGDGASWNSFANATSPSYISTGSTCSLTPVLLPSTLISFSGSKSNDNHTLNWEIEENLLVKNLKIYRSRNFDEKEIIFETSSIDLKDEFVVQNCFLKDNYYFIELIDNENRLINSEVISIFEETKTPYFSSIENKITFPKNTLYSIYSLEGKIIKENLATEYCTEMLNGILLLVNQETGIVTKIFI